MKSLLYFFNYIYSNGFPHQWHEAIIIPILKPGKISTAAASYRPIALTNCICKIFEKMANWRLQEFLEEKSFFDKFQSGFRSGHCTLDAHVRLESSIRESFISGKFCVALFIDISKAFDSVWHNGLLEKVKSSEVRGNLGMFIYNFLQTRSIRVKISSTTSSSFPLHAGVPQGSVVSPTLFNIMINDLFSDLDTNISYSIYADDGAAWTVASNINEAVNRIQGVIEHVIQWSHKWGLDISDDKTKAVVFTKKRPSHIPPLTLNGVDIEYVNEFKFLGIIFDRHLTWTPHISHIQSRCKRDLRLLSILANKRWGADFLSLRRFYIALVRSKIDYGSFLYSTACKTNLRKIDSLQNSAARLALGAHRCSNTRLLNIEAHLIPLHYRRNQLQSLYYCRALSVKDHPVYYLDSRLPYHLLSGLSVPPIAHRFSSELEKLQIDFKNIRPTPMFWRYKTYETAVKKSLSMYEKYFFDDVRWNLMFKDLVDCNYQNYTQIYTDGSKTTNSVSSAVWSRSFEIKAKLLPLCSIFTAELYAILCAILYISNMPISQVNLLSSLIL